MAGPPSLLPSEIARLVLGYLKDSGSTRSYNAFLRESPHLQEYATLLGQGQCYPTTILGQSLVQILDEHAQMRQAANAPADARRARSQEDPGRSSRREADPGPGHNNAADQQHPPGRDRGQRPVGSAQSSRPAARRWMAPPGSDRRPARDRSPRHQGSASARAHRRDFPQDRGRGDGGYYDRDHGDRGRNNDRGYDGRGRVSRREDGRRHYDRGYDDRGYDDGGYDDGPGDDRGLDNRGGDYRRRADRRRVDRRSQDRDVAVPSRRRPVPHPDDYGPDPRRNPPKRSRRAVDPARGGMVHQSAGRRQDRQAMSPEFPEEDDALEDGEEPGEYESDASETSRQQREPSASDTEMVDVNEDACHPDFRGASARRGQSHQQSSRQYYDNKQPRRGVDGHLAARSPSSQGQARSVPGSSGEPVPSTSGVRSSGSSSRNKSVGGPRSVPPVPVNKNLAVSSDDSEDDLPVPSVRSLPATDHALRVARSQQGQSQANSVLCQRSGGNSEGQSLQSGSDAGRGCGDAAVQNRPGCNQSGAGSLPGCQASGFNDASAGAEASCGTGGSPSNLPQGPSLHSLILSAVGANNVSQLSAYFASMANTNSNNGDHASAQFQSFSGSSSQLGSNRGVNLPRGSSMSDESRDTAAVHCEAQQPDSSTLTCCSDALATPVSSPAPQEPPALHPNTPQAPPQSLHSQEVSSQGVQVPSPESVRTRTPESETSRSGAAQTASLQEVPEAAVALPEPHPQLTGQGQGSVGSGARQDEAGLASGHLKPESEHPVPLSEKAQETQSRQVTGQGHPFLGSRTPGDGHSSGRSEAANGQPALTVPGVQGGHSPPAKGKDRSSVASGCLGDGQSSVHSEVDSGHPAPLPTVADEEQTSQHACIGHISGSSAVSGDGQGLFHFQMGRPHPAPAVAEVCEAPSPLLSSQVTRPVASGVPQDRNGVAEASVSSHSEPQVRAEYKADDFIYKPNQSSAEAQKLSPEQVQANCESAPDESQPSSGSQTDNLEQGHRDHKEETYVSRSPAQQQLLEEPQGKNFKQVHTMAEVKSGVPALPTTAMQTSDYESSVHQEAEVPQGRNLHKEQDNAETKLSDKTATQEQHSTELQVHAVEERETVIESHSPDVSSHSMEETQDGSSMETEEHTLAVKEKDESRTSQNKEPENTLTGHSFLTKDVVSLSLSHPEEDHKFGMDETSQSPLKFTPSSNPRGRRNDFSALMSRRGSDSMALQGCSSQYPQGACAQEVRGSGDLRISGTGEPVPGPSHLSRFQQGWAVSMDTMASSTSSGNSQQLSPLRQVSHLPADLGLQTPEKQVDCKGSHDSKTTRRLDLQDTKSPRRKRQPRRCSNGQGGQMDTHRGSRGEGEEEGSGISDTSEQQHPASEHSGGELLESIYEWMLSNTIIPEKLAESINRSLQASLPTAVPEPPAPPPTLSTPTHSSESSRLSDAFFDRILNDPENDPVYNILHDYMQSGTPAMGEFQRDDVDNLLGGSGGDGSAPPTPGSEAPSTPHCALEGGTISMTQAGQQVSVSSMEIYSLAQGLMDLSSFPPPLLSAHPLLPCPLSCSPHPYVCPAHSSALSWPLHPSLSACPL